MSSTSPTHLSAYTNHDDQRITLWRDLTLPLDWRGIGCSLHHTIGLGVQDHILGLERLQLVAEAFGGWLELNLLQQHFLGRGGEQLIQVSLIGRVFSARLQGLLQLVHYGHGASLKDHTLTN